jgi:hypothetical protein
MQRRKRAGRAPRPARLLANPQEKPMAKVIFGHIVADARNKISGNVFSKNKAGSFVRRKVSPSQPHTPRQSAVRSALSGLSKAWGGTLTDTQRAGWEGLAAANPVKDVFGSNIILTGLQMYIRLNQALLEAGQARIDDAPPALSVAAFTSLSGAAAAGAATFTATYVPTPVPAATTLEIWATQQFSPGRASFGGKYRLLQSFAPAAASPANIKAAYVAKFGTLVAGKKIGIGAVHVDNTTGARTQMFTATVTVAA